MFIGFGSKDPGKEVHNQEVREATDYVKNVLVPQYAAELEHQQLECHNIKEGMHRMGKIKDPKIFLLNILTQF